MLLCYCLVISLATYASLFGLDLNSSLVLDYCFGDSLTYQVLYESVIKV
jgi:hypothetical protein